MVINRRRASGFTLLEVMVVTVIMGILMAVGVPGIKTLLNVQKMKSATFDLVTTAMLARSEAIKWGSGNPANATAPSISIVAPSNNFSNGWCIVFTDALASHCIMSAPGDAVMQVIKPTANMTYGTAAPIVFNRTGRLAGGVPVTLRVRDLDDYATPRCVTFDTNGNARVRAMPDHTTAC